MKTKGANRFRKIASRLVADAEGFTVQRPIRFKPEGSTMNSLANARMILEAGYKLEDGYLTYDTNRGNYFTTAFFSRGDEKQEHQFKGFSLGYGGEGPHGLRDFLRMFGWNPNEDNIFGRSIVDAQDPGAVRFSNL